MPQAIHAHNVVANAVREIFTSWGDVEVINGLRDCLEIELLEYIADDDEEGAEETRTRLAELEQLVTNWEERLL